MAVIIESNARGILDSCGNPTVEVGVLLEDGVADRVVAPSGASTDVHEAYELRDGGNRYPGKGVEKAVCAVLEEIENAIIGLEAEDQRLVDKTMIELNGIENKSRLGANVILGVSMAVVKAAVKPVGSGLFRYAGGPNGHILPVPMMNILNDGAHADSGVDVQEFMIAPIGASTFKEALRVSAEVYHALEKVIKDKGLPIGLGDEGGFAPSVDSTEAALDLIVEVIEVAGYKLGDDVALALDVASSELYKDGKHHFGGGEHTAEGTAVVYADLVENYAIVSIEDPLREDDWEGHTKLTAQTGDKIQIVGDDFFAINPKRPAEGIEKKAANILPVKANQIGSPSGTFETVIVAHNAGYEIMMLHRFGETENITIADLATGLNCGQIKTGASARSKRVVKYNQLPRIEEYLGNAAVYAGHSAFPRLK